MANSVTGNIVTINATGAALAPKRTICSLTIQPSNTTWVVDLTNNAGVSFLRLNQDSPAPVFTTPITVDGIMAKTLTAITEVTIVLN